MVHLQHNSKEKETSILYIAVYEDSDYFIYMFYYSRISPLSCCINWMILVNLKIIDSPHDLIVAPCSPLKKEKEKKTCYTGKLHSDMPNLEM